MEKCEKCGYKSEDNKEVQGKYLCSICRHFAPSHNFQEYLNEKLDWKTLETFRKQERKNISGMEEKAREGRVMSRAAFGYKIINKELLVDEEKKLVVEDIFRTFLEKNISLNQLAKQYGFSVNGIKKMLKNFSYIGKIKFSGQITQGKHQPIISSELFNKVQSKLESLGI